MADNEQTPQDQSGEAKPEKPAAKKLPPREVDPSKTAAKYDGEPYRQTYSLHFAVVVGLLLIATVWGVVDEMGYSPFRNRRPWQDRQAAFRNLNASFVVRDLEAARQKVSAKHGADLESSRNKLAEAQAKLTTNEYMVAASELERSTNTAGDATQEYQFAKSEYDAIYYDYTHTYHSGHDTTDVAKEKAEAGADLEMLRVRMESLLTKRDVAGDAVALFTDPVDQFQRDIDDINQEVRQQTDRLSKVQGRSIEIQQVVIDAFDHTKFAEVIDRVDRCQSCHMGADRPGFEDPSVPLVFQTHPRRDFLLASHPVKTFGCTSCHEGQGPALEAGTAHGPADSHWEYPLNTGLYMEVNCRRCHDPIMVDAATEKEFVGPDVPEAYVATAAKHLFIDSGCHGCHEVRGYRELSQVGPRLGKIAYKTSPAFIYQWIKNPSAYSSHTRMPNSLLSDDDASSVVSYLVSIAGEEGNHHYEPDLSGFRRGNPSAGEKIVNEVGCRGCHVIGGEDRSMASGVPANISPADTMLTEAWRARQFGYFGPDLSTVGSKVRPEWLYDWIRNPTHYWPDTKMPSLRLTSREASDIVAYLTSQTKDDLVLAVDLGSGMDQLGLGSSPEEVRQVAAGIAPDRVTQGENVIRSYGCYGCHDITGMEKESRVSVALNSFGSKTPEELFFGDAVVDPEFSALASHMGVGHESWESWSAGKMVDARRYETEAVVQRMPNFNFDKDDAHLITVFLKSLDTRTIMEDYRPVLGPRDEAIELGRLLVHQRNCRGCHEVEGHGAQAIRGQIVHNYGGDATIASGFFPPSLTGEGYRVQADWLFGFLKNPAPAQENTLRPWVQARMPKFGFTNNQAATLAEYFAGLDGQEFPFDDDTKPEVSRADLSAGKMIFTFRNCMQCHPVGRPTREQLKTPHRLAPNLELAFQRLRREWINDWLLDPQPMLPGTNMPTFDYNVPLPIMKRVLGQRGSRNPSPSLRNSDVHIDQTWQIEVVKQYVLSLGVNEPRHW